MIKEILHSASVEAALNNPLIEKFAFVAGSVFVITPHWMFDAVTIGTVAMKFATGAFVTLYYAGKLALLIRQFRTKPKSNDSPE